MNAQFKGIVNDLGSLLWDIAPNDIRKGCKKNDSRNLIMLQLMEPSKKHIILTKIWLAKKKPICWSNIIRALKLTLKNSKNSINQLKKILDDKEMSDDEKLELLYDIRTQFKFTGQDKIPNEWYWSTYDER